MKSFSKNRAKNPVTLAAAVSFALVSGCLVAGSAGAADMTPAGSELAVGDSAVLPMRIPYKPEVPVKVTVTSIEEGTLADFTQYKVPPEAAETKPYYVHFTVTSLGPADVQSNSLGYTLAIDDRNEAHTATLTDGHGTGARFDRCKEGAFHLGAAMGATYEGCRIFLINRNGSMKRFAFAEFNTPYQKNPVVWVPGKAPTAPAPQTGAPQGSIVPGH